MTKKKGRGSEKGSNSEGGKYDITMWTSMRERCLLSFLTLSLLCVTMTAANPAFVILNKGTNTRGTYIKHDLPPIYIPGTNFPARNTADGGRVHTTKGGTKPKSV